MSIHVNDTKAPVILFDGMCNLCSSAVQFIIRHDRKNLFRFASLQSAFGQKLLQQFNLPVTDLSSFILYQDEKIFTRSTGALMVVKHLSGAWPLLYAFIILPRFVRDGIYNVVSRNRYQWFGRKTACWLPTPALQQRFIE